MGRRKDLRASPQHLRRTYDVVKARNMGLEEFEFKHALSDVSGPGDDQIYPRNDGSD